MSDLLDFDDDDLLGDDDDLLDMDDDLLGMGDDDMLELDDEYTPDLLNPVCAFRKGVGNNLDPNMFVTEVKRLAKICDPERPCTVSTPWKASKIFGYWLKNHKTTGDKGSLAKDECLNAVAALRVGAYTVTVDYLKSRRPRTLEARVVGASEDKKYVYVLMQLPEDLERLDNVGLVSKYYGEWLPLDGSVSHCGNWSIKPS